MDQDGSGRSGEQKRSVPDQTGRLPFVLRAQGEHETPFTLTFRFTALSRRPYPDILYSLHQKDVFIQGQIGQGLKISLSHHKIL